MASAVQDGVTLTAVRNNDEKEEPQPEQDSEAKRGTFAGLPGSLQTDNIY